MCRMPFRSNNKKAIGQQRALMVGIVYRLLSKSQFTNILRYGYQNMRLLISLGSISIYYYPYFSISIHPVDMTCSFMH